MSRALVELENFTESEVADLKDKLLIYLQVIRFMADVPIHITSGLRMGDSLSHGTGWAVDISDNRSGRKLDSQWRHKILKAAYAVGFERVGIYDKHLHIDLDLKRDQSVSWWAESD